MAAFLYNYSYWSLALQYMKTVCIVPFLFKRARLLQQQFNEKLEREYDLLPLTETYRVRHDEIDSSLLLIRKRVRTMGYRFGAIDVLVAVAFFILYLYRELLREKENLLFEIDDIFTNVFIKSMIATLIALSVYLISRFIKG